MKNNEFEMCCECANKISRPDLHSGFYYCPFVKNDLPNGIVHYTTDAIACVRKGFYNPIKK